MEHPEWIATIVGALLCLVFSWFLAVVSRSQGVSFGKAGPAIGIAGALVLAGMAVVGPLDVSEPEGGASMGQYTEEGYPVFPKGALRHAKLLSVAAITTQEIGPRPSKSHAAWEHSNGKREWVTKDEYVQLLKQRKDTK